MSDPLEIETAMPVPDALDLGEPDAGAANSAHARVDFAALARPLLSDAQVAVLSDIESGAGASLELCLAARPTSRRIAFLGSPELLRELAFDSQVVALGVEDGEERLSGLDVAYLLVETSLDTARNRFGSLAADSRERSRVEALLEACRARGLPVVVWFRAAPSDLPHFRWLVPWATRLYGVDEAIVSLLRDGECDARLGLLPPAIQPAIHNPLRPDNLQDVGLAFERTVLLDGWWDVVDAAHSEAGLPADWPLERLVVCESEGDYASEHLKDVPQLAERAAGSIGWLGKLGASKIAPFELVPEAPLAASWRVTQRVMRAEACGSTILQARRGGGPTTSAIGAPGGDGRTDDSSGAAGPLDGPVWERARRAQSRLMSLLENDCLEDRLLRIESDIECTAIAPAMGTPRVACILVTKRPQLVEGCLNWFRREHYPNRELIIVLHDCADALDELRELVRSGESVRLMALGGHHGLGACLNLAAATTDAPYWAKIDDDDYYGDHYLSDMMRYRRIRDFDIAGKPRAFVYLESGDELRWDPEGMRHAWMLHGARGERAVQVAGGTLMGKMRVLKDVRFSLGRRRGSDSDFVERCYRAGHDVLAADGFGFVHFRSAQPGFHTWVAPDSVFRDRAEHIGGHAVMREACLLGRSGQAGG